MTLKCENDVGKRTCKRDGDYSVSLIGSNSAANLIAECWQHVKKFRDHKFVEQCFGKGAQVEIRKEKP